MSCTSTSSLIPLRRFLQRRSMEFLLALTPVWRLRLRFWCVFHLFGCLYLWIVLFPWLLVKLTLLIECILSKHFAIDPVASIHFSLIGLHLSITMSILYCHLPQIILEIANVNLSIVPDVLTLSTLLVVSELAWKYISSFWLFHHSITMLKTIAKLSFVDITIFEVELALAIVSSLEVGTHIHVSRLKPLGAVALF